MSKHIDSIVVTGTDSQEYHHDLDAQEVVVVNNLHGFSSLSYFLPRKLSIAYNDIDYFLGVKAYFGLSVVFEGRMKSFERVIEEDREGFAITCEGWQNHLEDRKFVEIYDDTSFADWEAWSNNVDQVETDNNNRLYMAFPKGSWGDAWEKVAIGYYSVNAEKPITLLRWDRTSSFNDSWFDAFLYGDTTDWANSFVSAKSWGNGTASNVTGNLAAGNDTYAFFALVRNQTYNEGSGQATNNWLKITDIHLTTVPNTYSFFPTWPTAYGDEVIKYTASAYVPKLSTDYSNLDSPSAQVLPLKYDAGGTALEVFDQVALVGDTTSGQWDWSVWEEQKIWFKPRNLTGAVYYTAISDGMQGIPQADADNLANEVRVHYTDWKDRSWTYVLTDTADTDCPLNVGAVSGTIRTHEQDLGYNATSAKAAQIAGMALSQVKYPLANGPVTLTREPQDSAGNRMPLPLVRAGNLLRIRDFATSDAGFTVGSRTYGVCDFYIVEASFDDDAGVVSLTLDNSKNALEDALATLQWHRPAKEPPKKKKKRKKKKRR